MAMVVELYEWRTQRECGGGMLLEVAYEDDGVRCKETCSGVGVPLVIHGPCGDGGPDGRHHVMVLLVCSRVAPLSATSLLIRVFKFIVHFWF